MSYEELLEEACKENIYVIESANFVSQSKGLISGDVIGLNSCLKTYSEKADVLAEELGHYYTTVGRIIEQDSVNARKQERRARLWGYNKRIGLIGIINAYKAHCRSLFEVAEYLDVSEEALKEALEYYRQIYGRGEMIDNYFIQFEPYLTVYEYLTF